MKIALQYRFNRGETARTRFVSFRHGYHGDTFMTMSVCDPEEGMHQLFGAVLPRQLVLPIPSTPASVHIVEQIVSDFRSGRQNVAEFWIELHGKFVHIRYFAVRNEAGKYLGTLEVTQDLTRLRELQGERRLLQYDAPAQEASP